MWPRSWTFSTAPRCVHCILKLSESSPCLVKGEERAFASSEYRDDLNSQLMALRLQRRCAVETFNRVVLQHEAAHQVLFNLGVHVRGARTPVWLVEGLACQFEVPQSDAQGVLKRVNQMRLGDLRDALGVQRDVADVARSAHALEKGKLQPLARLLTAEQFQRASRPAHVQYAQAWSLVHYLHRQHPKNFAKYVAVLAERTPGTDLSSGDDIGRIEGGIWACGRGFHQGLADFHASPALRPGRPLKRKVHGLSGRYSW